MDSLAFRGGKLLWAGGGLTTREDCCCDPPPPRPPCCVRIDWGEFDPENDRHLVGTTVEQGDIEIKITVVVPNAGSRYVCDEEIITVIMESADGETDIVGGFIRWGPAWESIDWSPSGEAYQTKHGLVDWQGASETHYQVDLVFNKCYLDDPLHLATLKVGATFPRFFQELDVDRPLASELCCETEIDCEDCCNKLNADTSGFIVLDAENHEYVIARYGLDTTTLIFLSLEDGRICEGDTLQLDIQVIPRRHIPSENIGELKIFADFPWGIECGLPPGCEKFDDGFDLKGVKWDPAIGYEYSANLEYSCETRIVKDEHGNVIPNPEACTTTMPEATSIVVTGGAEGDEENDPDAFPVAIDGGIDFEECNLEDCCCPVLCECGCLWQSPEEFCDEATEETEEGILNGFWMPGKTIVEDFEMEFTGPPGVFDGIGANCGADIDTVHLEQRGPSRLYAEKHTLGDKCCPVPYKILVPVKETIGSCENNSAWIALAYNESCDLVLAADGLQLGSQFLPLILDAPADCTELSGSGSFSSNDSNAQPDETIDWEILGGTISAEECPCGEP